MVRFLYSTLFTLCMPFVLLKLLWRGSKAPEYKARRFERLGRFEAPSLKKSIWFHTVSVGELLAAEPIIRKVMSDFSDRSVVVTTMTPTSSELVKKLFGESVFHVYAPYDLPVCVKAFLRRVRPEFLVIMETELWPNMIHKANQSGCPVVVANARLSERSAAGYRRLKPAIGWMLDGLSLVLCQHSADAERFASLGIGEDKIFVTGSVKYDISISESLVLGGTTLRRELPKESLIWVAASTHEGEDALVLNVHKALRKKFPGLVLVLVPRHPERFDSAVEQSSTAGFRTYRRTAHELIPEDTEVFVVDTMGELLMFYAACDLAFIGGSFAEVGGHNPIEAAALAKPVLMGPHYFNFEAICKQMMSAGALQITPDERSFQDAMAALLGDKESAHRMGQQALEMVEQGRGAVDRVMNHLGPLLRQSE